MNEVTALASDERTAVARANRERALEHVQRLAAEPLGHFIDGAATSGGEPFDVFDPSTGDVIGQALAGTA
jgi:hypothetical protein